MIAKIAGLADFGCTLHTEACHMREGSENLSPVVHELNPMEIDIDGGGTVFEGQPCKQGLESHEPCYMRIGPGPAHTHLALAGMPFDSYKHCCRRFGRFNSLGE